MKNEYVCSLYPTLVDVEEEEDKLIDCQFNPETYRVDENRECFYCTRAKDKVVKDRYNV